MNMNPMSDGPSAIFPRVREVLEGIGLEEADYAALGKIPLDEYLDPVRQYPSYVRPVYLFDLFRLDHPVTSEIVLTLWGDGIHHLSAERAPIVAEHLRVCSLCEARLQFLQGNQTTQRHVVHLEGGSNRSRTALPNRLWDYVVAKQLAVLSLQSLEWLLDRGHALLFMFYVVQAQQLPWHRMQLSLLDIFRDDHCSVEQLRSFANRDRRRTLPETERTVINCHVNECTFCLPQVQFLMDQNPDPRFKVVKSTGPIRSFNEWGLGHSTTIGYARALGGSSSVEDQDYEPREQ